MAWRLRSIAALVAATIAPTQPASAQDACKLHPIGTAQVTAVRDGRTLVLADGRIFRLAAIEAPPEAGAELRKLTAGATLRLESAGQDRYGRLVGFAYAGAAGESLQQALIAAGAARVSARVGGMDCAKTLLKAEQVARAGHRGLWADPNFAPLAAKNLPGLAARRGQFALVEGKILSVHASGATLYMNFGRRWTRDFSVIILRRNERKFAAAGVAPQRLRGRRIRVRGFLERRGGPLIEADSPEQIEPLD